MRAAVEHYMQHELADNGAEGKAYSTRNRKTLVLRRWVLPQWRNHDLRAIKTVAVEQWLKTLLTSKFGKLKPLAGGTKEKIRDAMSAVFNHAIRWEFTDANPITGPHKGSGVRVSGKRERAPEILDVEEMQLLLASLGVREKAMVFLDMPAGLRRGELAGLKWEDVDFKHLHLRCEPVTGGPARWPGQNRGVKKADADGRIRCSRSDGLVRANALQATLRLPVGDRR